MLARCTAWRPRVRADRQFRDELVVLFDTTLLCVISPIVRCAAHVACRAAVQHAARTQSNARNPLRQPERENSAETVYLRVRSSAARAGLPRAPLTAEAQAVAQAAMARRAGVDIRQIIVANPWHGEAAQFDVSKWHSNVGWTRAARAARPA
jgi:hypothetical protein